MQYAVWMLGFVTKGSIAADTSMPILIFFFPKVDQLPSEPLNPSLIWDLLTLHSVPHISIFS